MNFGNSLLIRAEDVFCVVRRKRVDSCAVGVVDQEITIFCSFGVEYSMPYTFKLWKEVCQEWLSHSGLRQDAFLSVDFSLFILRENVFCVMKKIGVNGDKIDYYGILFGLMFGREKGNSEHTEYMIPFPTKEMCDLKWNEVKAMWNGGVTPERLFFSTEETERKDDESIANGDVFLQPLADSVTNWLTLPK